jgi:hypothetical protein
MFNLQVVHQENYSKKELLLRSFFGVFYIAIPHFLVVLFFITWGKLLWLYSVFVVLLTGKLPENIFQYQVKLLSWLSRIHISVYNLADGYPEFGLNGKSEVLTFEIPYNETPNRKTVLLRFVLVPLVVLPHLFIWAFRNVASVFLTIAAFFSVLFTGKYPKKWFDFNVGTLRWIMRVFAYLVLLTDEYPPFSGEE